jgi:hypothetical protein
LPWYAFCAFPLVAKAPSARAATPNFVSNFKRRAQIISNLLVRFGFELQDISLSSACKTTRAPG